MLILTLILSCRLENLRKGLQINNNSVSMTGQDYNMYLYNNHPCVFAACSYPSLPICYCVQVILLRYIFNTRIETTCGLYYNYAERILVTISGRQRVIRCDQQSEQGQYAQTLGQDDLSIRARIVIEGLPNSFVSPISITRINRWYNFSGTSQRYYTLGSSPQVDITKTSSS